MVNTIKNQLDTMRWYTGIKTNHKTCGGSTPCTVDSMFWYHRIKLT